MAIPVVGGAARVRLRMAWKNSNQYGLCINNYYCFGIAGNPTTLADVVKGFDTLLAAYLIDLVPANAQYWGVGCAIMQNAEPHQATPEYYCKNGRAPGSATGDLLPTQSSGLASLRTAQVGRSGRGRIYFPFPPTSAIDADAALQTVYKTAIDTMLSSSNQPNIANAASDGSVFLQRIIISRIYSGAGIDVTHWIIRDYMATQRRREELNRADSDPFAGAILVT